MTVTANNGGGEGGTRSFPGDSEERTVFDSKPVYIRYSLRGLGAFAGAICLVFGVLNIIFHPLNVWCVFLSILQILFGFIVATNEVAGGTARICFCIYIRGLPSVSAWLGRQPLWVKPMLYIVLPLPIMVFCTTWNTVIGCGFVLIAGIAYMIALWDLESPSRNQNTQPPFQSHTNTTMTAPTPTTSNPSSSSGGGVGGIRGLFTKHSDNNASSSPTSPKGPTFIDIRPPANNLNTNNTSSASQNRNPLATKSHGTHDDDDDNRYENIHVISGNNNTTSGTNRQTEIEMSSPSRASNYMNLDDGDGTQGGIFPSTTSPFTFQNQNRTTTGRNKDEEFNC